MKEQRHLQICQFINQNGQATSKELSDQFGVSDITIRRDLYELAESGLIRRTHGGGMILNKDNGQAPVIHRMVQNQQEKETIALTAAALINDGNSVFLGSGSTIAFMAKHLLHRKRLTVVTNALNIGIDFANAEDITVVVTGGMMRPSELSLIGHISDQALREVRVDKVVIGIPAIDIKAGLTNDYLPEVITDRIILDLGSELILLADHSKFGKLASAYLAPINRVTTLVTDSQTDPQILDQIKAMGVNVIIAE
ncbi:MAG: DeoR/GlpR family DNA-binding transcription regulator [Sedimentisphaerales bacterium]